MWYVAGAQLVLGVTVRWVAVASQLRFTGTFGWTWSEPATLVGSIGALNASVIGARTDVFAAMDDVNAVNEALRNGHIAHGPGVERFEREVSQYLGFPGAIATSTGTSALFAAIAG